MASSKAGFKEVMCVLSDIMRIHRPRAGQESNGLVQSALAKESECPFPCGRKIGLCSSFFLYKPQGACRSRANVSRLGGRASLEAIPIGRDKAKSRWFSKSKNVCAGASGKVPRLCAIWTPQCGGMKGKLCFIKRKSNTLVSNNRIFREKNISFFENRERLNKNLWTFFRNSPSFLFFLPIFLGNDARSFPPRHSPFLPPQLLTRGRTRPCASRTQRVRNSCLHPSPSPAIC